MVIEIRGYNLRPGSRPGFHLLMVERAVPMLRRWRCDVVAFGPSLHDEDSYHLVRAYRSLAHRQDSQDAFYESAEWREGPREALLACIESYTSVVRELDEATVEGLRAE